MEHYIYTPIIYILLSLKTNAGNIAECVVSEEGMRSRRNARWFSNIPGTGSVSKNLMYVYYNSLRFVWAYFLYCLFCFLTIWATALKAEYSNIKSHER